MKNRKLLYTLLTIFLVLGIDQALKIYVKTNFYYHESYHVLGDWFKLTFVENPGFAYGWEIPFLGADVAKITLSLFRVVAISFIGIYLFSFVKKGVKLGFLVATALVFSGAAGNIIDSAFYGLIFTDSVNAYRSVAEIVPVGTGYAGFLMGDVVDMLSFDLFTVDLPIIGKFNFFAPVFNFADFAISLGVGLILFFYRKEFQENFFEGKKKEKEAASTDTGAETTSEAAKEEAEVSAS